ncbi:hypothetical protein Zmor_020069 [Zophobas morio]|uniref:Guanylate cyclase domain-containing protein n=1 Tax=Zophobas morio TaxID=2755281 RepID=A0AA38I4R7_9CUCU|nr:hypothetical protein Zmor_020069 [Zophobas morio]
MGQEEYVWAMRSSLYRESDSELWKERRSEGSRSVLNEIGVKKSKSSANTVDYQTKVMASLVPDEVIYNVEDYNHRQYDACFLFGDVSGFTELCEKYTKTGVSGPSRMTQVLNKYLGSMVQEVLSHDGDVLKFSGDAFLAMFKIDEDSNMRDAVHQALDCALVIQKNYGSYLTDVNVVIRVKLAISAGLVTFALIGTKSLAHYVVVGKPIWDVKAAEHISSAGDIIVAPAAWYYVSAAEYIFNEMPDSVHIKLVGIGPNWRRVERNVRQQKQHETDEGSVDALSLNLSEDEEQDWTAGAVTEDFSLRPAVNFAVRNKIKENLRRFIIAPVMKSIDMQEPFEYLTEMRQTVIVFINVVSHTIETKETVILADQTYKIVCRVVEKMKGCVNKVSLFDKDLMFVVIFGLRGLKYELECQVALRCARECHQTISKLPSVLSASIGVTTGKTYCGVFGHSLRREYTVISLIVNKAARLMVAYKGKVTCDRETFLHSKLESRHFILQEHKPLKGISHPGPVYEFREAEEDHGERHKINARPLLGREEKLEIYKNLIQKYVSAKNIREQQYKMLLIKGEARQGKTRLLDEIVYITPEEIPVIRFSLTTKDQKIPYQAIRLIFSSTLSLNKDSSIKEKEQQLLKRLRQIQVPDLLCTLNAVFGVRFKNSSLFLSLAQSTRTVTLMKMIKQLAYACFVRQYVLAIDNFDYIDKESWQIFNAFFDIKNIFIVGTLCYKKIDSDYCEKVLSEDPRVKTIILDPIEKWYLGALACQILDVYAISPELENVIQIRSNGNPGWIESFLISLFQDEGVYILKASMRDINDLGLVAPPLYLMARLTQEDAFQWQHIMEEKRRLITTETEQHWQKYIDSCRDSYMNITIRELLESIITGGKVPIGVISPNFHVGDEEAELSMDAMIMKTFDSLNFFEQLVVKCSAILGIQFLRDMMVYVMNGTDKKKTALAVKKLFEIRVLTCAKGDFLDENASFFKIKEEEPSDENIIECRCKGIKIPECCLDLPRYASCGYLQFKSTQFRDITYNLLTDKQKKEFHQRAIRYLERETRKCKACGQGFFERILENKEDRDFVIAKRKFKKRDGEMFEDMDTLSRRTSSHSISTVFSSSSSKFKKSEDGKSIGSLISGQPTIDRGHKPFDSAFGFRVINKLKESFSLTRGFSSEDFTDCQCLLILSTTYLQLIEHCTGAGDLPKLTDAMIEYSYISITLCNIPLALRTLDEALQTVKKRAKLKTEGDLWKLSLIRGKIYTLLGYARIEMGQLDEAFSNLCKSLFEYNTSYPTSSTTKNMKTCLYVFKQLFGFYVFPNTLTKHLDYWEVVYSNNLAECLTQLSNLYIIKNEWKNAKLAASWALCKAVAAFSNFQLITITCANMLHVAHRLKMWRLCIALEVHALRMCHMKKDTVDAEDLKCVARLYSTIFFSRMLRSTTERAIHMGYTVLRLCTAIRAVNIILPLLPLFFHALLLGKHFSNVLSILQELEYFATEDSDSSGKVWYLALCVVVHLETGFTVIPYHSCMEQYQVEGDRWVTIRDPDARKRFFTVMWLWCIRNEKWEEAAVWCLKTNDFTIIKENDTLANKFTALYLLEGMILFLVSKLDKRNIKAVMGAEKEIEHLISALDKASKTAQIILPRFHHLKAYYKFVKNFDVKLDPLLKKAQKFAAKYRNDLEAAWLEHTSKAWKRQLPNIVVDFWKEHSEADNVLDFQEIESEDKIGFFTLPAPLYV